ncbi:alpha/beta fold hydrolase [Actinomadura sp. 3N407]|uniref:alpha/beta fold hydrolase n=1 Tax=Actinomadura sp. 3N407 TaxID=3457423 RepID=UPI003FCD1F95
MKTRHAALTAAALGTALLATAVPAAAVPAAAAPASCDRACQEARKLEARNALPRTGFYDAPDPLPHRPAGTPIRTEPADDYVVEGRPLPATRILYHSRTSRGRDVAASGVVLVPPGTPPQGGWPVVVDAHGTSGAGPSCAPSLMRDLYHGDQMSRFLERGWAVVAPDYAGLGATGRHEFLNRTAAANDVINAMRSAHQAIPGLSPRWVVWGHSQGGHAALAVAERHRVRAEPGYLGSVVTSPGADLPAALQHMTTAPGLGGFIALVAAGAKVSERGLPLGRILAAPALARLNFTRTDCLPVVSTVYGGLGGDELLKPGALRQPRFARHLAANSVGHRPVGGPVLLLQGEADVVLPTRLTDRLAADMCTTGSHVDYRTYPGLGHDTYPGQVVGIDDGAMPDILTWTAARFAGEPAPSSCP